MLLPQPPWYLRIWVYIEFKTFLAQHLHVKVTAYATTLLGIFLLITGLSARLYCPKEPSFQH
ncbi:hypothetical protein I79_001915 [Cricetulus griseus]|uniref:Uncharacterized protein n=1 Tax=Cricetulus griseus TaxID=10029 RepID=G3GW08_CRIGR|nr:hypothetical protein I79_001915 [Cricetulus griseus]